MDVIAGDVIGVVTTRDAVLPVVGNSNGVRLLFSQSAAANVHVNTENLTPLNNMALHVTAEIGKSVSLLQIPHRPLKYVRGRRGYVLLLWAKFSNTLHFTRYAVTCSLAAFGGSISPCS